nr:pentapeptide repeat-containing protein [Pseudanabaena yagii]
MVADLYEKLLSRSLVAVMGASGSGKSSLVFAGLLPRLRVEGWLVENFRPKTNPFYGLAEAFVRLIEPDLLGSQLVKEASDLSEFIKRKGISEVVASLTHKYARKSLLIVVDQFEEIFTCKKQEQEHFLKVLLDGLTKISGFKLIVILRADFCGQAYGERTLTDAFQDAQFLVGPMNLKEFQEAIQQPAKLEGLELEPGLIDRLLQDVGEEGQESRNLPLLEFALTKLWERQKNGRLTHQAYTDIHGVKGALVQHANQVYARLSRDQQQQASQLFTRLVRLGSGTEDTRKITTRSEIGDWELVTILANERLVMTGRDEQLQEDTVELIHEALIREWKLLEQWVSENRNLRQLIQTVEDARKVWLVGKKRENLLEGRLLKNAKQLLDNRIDIGISKGIQSFVRWSLLWRRLQIVALLLIPLLIVGMPIEYFSREDSVKQDYFRMEISSEQADREAVLNLAGGCWAEWQYPEMPSYLRERLFGNCRSLRAANLKKSYLQNLNLRGVDLHEADLSGSRLGGADLSGSELESANLSGSDLSITNLSGANLWGANLSNTGLFGTNLINASLISANLNNARLVGADLRGADLRGANFERVTFSCADTVYRAYPEFIVSKIKQCPNLKDIKWDKNTNWKGIEVWGTWDIVENIPPELKEQFKDK